MLPSMLKRGNCLLTSVVSYDWSLQCVVWLSFWICLMKICKVSAQGNKVLCNIGIINALLIYYAIKMADFALCISKNLFVWRHQCGMFPTPPNHVANVVRRRVCKQPLISKNIWIHIGIKYIRVILNDLVTCTPFLSSKRLCFRIRVNMLVFVYNFSMWKSQYVGICL
jgi:hypothetical protein